MCVAPISGQSNEDRRYTMKIVRTIYKNRTTTKKNASNTVCSNFLSVLNINFRHHHGRNAMFLFYIFVSYYFLFAARCVLCFANATAHTHTHTVCMSRVRCLLSASVRNTHFFSRSFTLLSVSLLLLFHNVNNPN